MATKRQKAFWPYRSQQNTEILISGYTESNVKPVLKLLVIVRGRKEHHSARVHECMLSQPHPRLICHIQFQNTEMATLEMSSQGFRTGLYKPAGDSTVSIFYIIYGWEKRSCEKKHSLDSSLRQRLKTGRRWFITTSTFILSLRLSFTKILHLN